MAKGDRLLKDIYEALRAGPKWEKTMLVVVYDDTGGWYDQVVPPHVDVPNDGAPCNVNTSSKCGTSEPFDFRRLGQRSAAMLISPLVGRGAVHQHPSCSSRFKAGPFDGDCTDGGKSVGSDDGGAQFEHSSLPATAKSLFNLSAFLTFRDAWAGDLSELLTEPTPRTDTPMHFPEAHSPQKPFLPPFPIPGTPPPPPPTGAVAVETTEARRRLLAADLPGTPTGVPQHCSARERPFADTGTGSSLGSDRVHHCPALTGGGPNNKQRNQMAVLGTLTGKGLPDDETLAGMNQAAASVWIEQQWISYMGGGTGGSGGHDDKAWLQKGLKTDDADHDQTLAARVHQLAAGKYQTPGVSGLCPGATAIAEEIGTWVPFKPPPLKSDDRALNMHINVTAPLPGADNPLAGLPALPTMHHSYGMCRPGPPGVMPWTDCGVPVDSSSALQIDFARITRAWAIQVAFNAGGYPAHTAAGVPVWNESVVEATQNKTEVIEATKLCALANASISVNYSPWAQWWGSSPMYCPTGPNLCDPTIRGEGEELELRFFRLRLGNIAAWIAETNAELGSSVTIGAVLLDCEQFLINWSNETQLAALERKDDLIYNVSREFCDPGLGCTIEQYNRGTIAQEKTLAKPAEGIPADDAWTPWPGYPACRGLGDTFATSL